MTSTPLESTYIGAAPELIDFSNEEDSSIGRNGEHLPFDYPSAKLDALPIGDDSGANREKAYGISIKNGSKDDGGSIQAAVNIPSSQYEAEILSQLNDLLQLSSPNVKISYWQQFSIVWRLFPSHILPVVVTFIMLFLTWVSNRETSTALCVLLFTTLYAFSTWLQVLLVWTRMTETILRTASVMSEVILRWRSRIEAMPHAIHQTAEERRAVFLESFAVLPAKAFRMVAVVDELTLRLKYIHKSLVIKKTKRLDEATLRARRYLEPTSVCKLVDVMRVTLESDAIVLKPLEDKARPPRLPNFLMTSKRSEEPDDTTDESDHERDSRTALGGGNSISVSQYMEYFVQRVLFLIWSVALVLLIVAGVIWHFAFGISFSEAIFLDPPVALLGLLPVNALILNRILCLFANVYLDKLFHYLVCKRVHSLDDRLPRFPFWSTFTTMIRVIFGIPPAEGGRNPLCFSASLVDGFGTATVVAVLDQTGIVTDMVLLPLQVLMIKEATNPESSSSSDSEDIVGFLNERGKEEARERRRDMKRQIKRKKFQDQRFLVLQLTPNTGRDPYAVQFRDENEFHKFQGNINPVCLCVLIHAMAKEPSNLETWTEPFRFCDRSLRWARSMHWIARAAGFEDSACSQFKVVARIFQIDTGKTGYHNEYPEQACSLLVSDEEDTMHVFTIGTPFLLTKCCNSHWTGSTVEELDKEAKAEIVYMAKHQWEDGMCLETVALSHRILPERYRKYVDLLEKDDEKYSEFFFRNGKEVSGESSKKMALKQGKLREGKKSFESDDNCARDLDAERSKKGVYSTLNGGAHISVLHSVEDKISMDSKGKPLISTRTYFGDNEAPQSASLPVTPLSTRPQRTKTLVKRASFGSNPTEIPGKFEEDEGLTSNTFIHFLATTCHTFLGLVGLRDSVRPNVQNAMGLLDEAGIRCMYFCTENERRTKSFGGRVGVETDWNCCISLKEGEVALDPHSIRAQLPYGIKSIRKHILHVDPIPLQVSLFSHAHGVSTRSMLSILQDNHEVVIAIGSVFNHGNVRSFVQADLSIGVLPTRKGPIADKEVLLGHPRVVEPSDFAASKSLNRDLPLYHTVAELIGCSCTLRSPPTTSVLPIITTMIRQARLRISGIGNCVEFIMHANLLLVCVNSVAILIGSPLLISPTGTLFELNVIIPILALSCTYTAYSGMDPMRTMGSRHNYFVRLAILRHNTMVWLLRYTPSCAALVALGISAGMTLCDTSFVRLSKHNQDVCLDATRGYVTLILNYVLLIHNWTHISRHYAISFSFSLRLVHGKESMYLFKSLRWVSTSVLAIVLSIAFTVMTTPYKALRSAFYPSLPHFLIGLFYPFLILALDVPIKRWREKRFNVMQKFKKLSYGTRLGMHSPRGDYEPEGVFYNTNSYANTGVTDNSSTIPLRKRLHDVFYRFTSMRGGKLELNCVCCDHIGGNYATYHANSNY